MGQARTLDYRPRRSLASRSDQPFTNGKPVRSTGNTPIAAEDVATAITRAAVSRPVNGMTEIAGPEKFGMDDFIRPGLAAHEDPSEVLTDPAAPYFGAVIDDGSIVPGAGATLFETRFTDWLVTNVLSDAR